jgi:Flp pilus assembly protein TadB
VAVWCDDVATEIRSGSTVRAAILTVVPDDPRISDVVTRIRRRIERGSNVRDSCRALATDRAVQRGEPELSSALTVIAETAEVGGSVGVPIERVAAAARLRAADELDRAAHSAQARLSAHVLTFVPITVFVVLAIGDRRVIAIATSPSGIAIVAFGIVLNALGWLWMQAIIRGRER